MNTPIKLLTILSLVLSLSACDQIQQITGIGGNDDDKDKAIVVTQKTTTKRVALLIANADYNKQTEIAKLDNPINDITLIKERLEKLGYTVKTLDNATEKQMNNAIDQFAIDAKNADSAIFYYSGHGMQDEAYRNFLVPIDAEIHTNSDIESDGVPARKIIDGLKKSNTRLSLVVFDACRNNPFFKNRGYRSFGIKDYHVGSELLISYSTQDGKFAQDGEGDYSPYAFALAKQLELAESKPLLKMFDEVKKEVRKITNYEQSPTKSGDVEVETMLFSVANDKPIKPIKEGENTTSQKQEIIKLNSELTPFKENGKYGYKRNGKVIILPQYDYANLFSEGLASVKKDDKRGYINKQGEVVIPLKYDFVYSFRENLACVKKDGKWFFINKQGELLSNKKYNLAWSFSEDLALVSNKGLFGRKYGFINKKGEEVIPLKYDNANWFSEGLAQVGKEGVFGDKYGFINKKGELVIPLKYDFASSFSGGLAMIKEKSFFSDKYGFINKKEELMISLKYDNAQSFSEGLASVRKDGKWGYINKKGKVIISLQYEYTYSFRNGVAKVRKDGEKFFINKQGQRVDK